MALAGRADGKGRTRQQGGLDEDAHRGDEQEKVLAPLVRADTLRDLRIQLGLWWWFIPPGVAITAIVGALYITNVGLDEVFNPKLRNT